MRITNRIEGPTAQPRKQRGHTLPQAPIIPLDQPGRLRVAHILAILGVSHSTLYSGLKRREGAAQTRYPQPDGYDGRVPYWNTDTIRRFLTGSLATSAAAPNNLAG
jgi:hypothetical protein